MRAARAGALGRLTVLLPLCLSLGLAGTTVAAPATLQDCVGITDSSARLACYDRVAGRPVSRSAASAASPATVPAPNPESFGKYQAEHPAAPPVAPQLEARVLSVGASASGHTTVTLEGDAVWELNETDPLLAVGDKVTITRATLGSYLMQTPEKRLHRVRRLH
jgi:hypothetical protein